MYALKLINLNLLSQAVKSLRRTQFWASNLSTDNFISEAKIERLNDRSILSVSGNDAVDFLQGLITNDINILLKEKHSIYTMFLNGRGRVIHDAIIYKSNNNSFLIESDLSSLQALQIHLTMYQSRNEINLENKEHDYTVWAIFNPIKDDKLRSTSFICPNVPGKDELSFLEEINFGEDTIVCHDPRLYSLGIRILAPTGMDVINLIKLNGYNINKATTGEFKLLRYRLGIGEGIGEILYGKYYPNDLNCDYLNAWNKKKENYLGSIALKNHITQGRIMPIKLVSKVTNKIPTNTPILDLERKKRAPLGHLLGIKGIYGIAHVRIFDSNEEKDVRIGNTISLAQCLKPLWWPEIGQNIQVKQNINFAKA